MNFRPVTKFSVATGFWVSETKVNLFYDGNTYSPLQSHRISTESWQCWMSLSKKILCPPKVSKPGGASEHGVYNIHCTAVIIYEYSWSTDKTHLNSMQPQFRIYVLGFNQRLLNSEKSIFPLTLFMLPMGSIGSIRSIDMCAQPMPTFGVKFIIGNIS